jgi:hypothetical protein
MIFWSAILNCCVLTIFSQYVNVTDYWDVNTQKGIMKGQYLRIRKILHPNNPFHTCYEIECEGNQCLISRENNGTTISVCYPAVIITGLPKCGTSGMYGLLSQFPGSMKMEWKENCPHHRRRSHWKFFLSLPSIDKLKANSLIIDGCIDLSANMKIRTILHDPDTLYIVSVLIKFFVSTNKGN